MDPKHVLEVAEFLAGRSVAPTEEARSRSAVSRAYYAVYCAAAASLDKLGFGLRQDPAGHTKTARYMNQSGLADAVELGKILDGLRDERNEADYRLNARGFDGKAAGRAIERARRGLEILATVNVPALQAGIATYLKKIGELR